MTPADLWATLTAVAVVTAIVAEWRERGALVDSLVAITCGGQMLRWSDAPW